MVPGLVGGPQGWSADTVFPAYKRGVQACGFVRSSRLATDERCHLPPRADRMPRPFSSRAMDASEWAPVSRIAWMTGTAPEANSSAERAAAALPREPA